MPRVLAAIVVAAALSSACAAASDRPPRVDTSVVRAQLDSMWSGYTRSMIEGNSAALAALYTDSATFAETGFPTTRGRAAIVSGAASALAQVRYLESRPQIDLTELAGDRAFQFGSYRDVIQPTGQPPVAAYGRFAAVAQRDAGVWRISHLVVIRDSVVPRQR